MLCKCLLFRILHCLHSEHSNNIAWPIRLPRHRRLRKAPGTNQSLRMKVTDVDYEGSRCKTFAYNRIANEVRHCRNGRKIVYCIWLPCFELLIKVQISSTSSTLKWEMNCKHEFKNNGAFNPRYLQSFWYYVFLSI